MDGPDAGSLQTNSDPQRPTLGGEHLSVNFVRFSLSLSLSLSLSFCLWRSRCLFAYAAALGLPVRLFGLLMKRGIVCDSPTSRNRMLLSTAATRLTQVA